MFGSKQVQQQLQALQHQQLLDRLDKLNDTMTRMFATQNNELTRRFDGEEADRKTFTDNVFSKLNTIGTNVTEIKVKRNGGLNGAVRTYVKPTGLVGGGGLLGYLLQHLIGG